MDLDVIIGGGEALLLEKVITRERNFLMAVQKGNSSILHRNAVITSLYRRGGGAGETKKIGEQQQRDSQILFELLLPLFLLRLLHVPPRKVICLDEEKFLCKEL